MAVGLAVAETVGLPFTVKATVCEAEQPKASIALTVYIVVVIGETETVAPVKLPGFQV